MLEQQVRRMLADPRLGIAGRPTSPRSGCSCATSRPSSPTSSCSPTSTRTLRAALPRETELFLDSMLRENRSVLDLLTANYTFLNERLAQALRHPERAAAATSAASRFPSGSPRGGLLGQGSILTLTSYATRTSPVLRGKWVLENLLAAPPPPPPPNVPALKTEGDRTGQAADDARGDDRSTAPARRARAATRGWIRSASRMENFDAVGRWRDHDSGAADRRLRRVARRHEVRRRGRAEEGAAARTPSSSSTP